MHTFPGQYLLSANSLYFDYDPSLIVDFLGYLNPQNFRVFVISQTLAQQKEAELLKEPWYGTQYRSEDLPVDFLKSLEAPTHNPALFLHPLNEFVPENLDLLPTHPQDVTGLPFLFSLPLALFFDFLFPFLLLSSPVLQKGEFVVLIRDTELSRVWFKKDSLFLVPKANIQIIIRT